MLSKKILTIATIASALTLGTIGSVCAESAAVSKDSTKIDVKVIAAERITPIGLECIRKGLPCNSTIPADANLKRSKAIISTYSPEQKEKLLNTLTDVKLKDLKSVEAITERLGDKKLIEAFKQDAGVSDAKAKINWKKVLFHAAMLIAALCE
jgi:hypothetical protein